MRIFAARERNEYREKPKAKASGEGFLGDFFLKRSLSPVKAKQYIKMEQKFIYISI